MLEIANEEQKSEKKKERINSPLNQDHTPTIHLEPWRLALRRGSGTLKDSNAIRDKYRVCANSVQLMMLAPFSIVVELTPDLDAPDLPPHLLDYVPF